MPKQDRVDSTQQSPDVHLNLNVRGMSTSPTVAINERSDELRAAGRKIFKLGLGQSPFPVAAPVVESLRTHAAEKDYLAVQGLPALRQAVADYHRRRDGIDRGGDEVLIGPGSKELMFLLQMVYYGDLVIPTPAWVSYAPQARIIGRHVKMISTRPDDDWRLNPEALAALCEEDPTRPRVVILNYPSNPTGATYDAAQLQALAEVARRYRIVILSDEIYAELHHQGTQESIARYYPEGTIVSSGLSKWCGAGGWRLGTFLFPPNMRWLLEAMAAAASETYTSTCAPIQYAAVTAFQGGEEIDRYLVHSRRILAALGTWTHARLTSLAVQCAAPAGGFYLFPDLSCAEPRLVAHGHRGSIALCERILEDTGVAILPGVAFGRPADELTVRIAYVDFDGRRALEAASQTTDLDEAFIRQHCPAVTEAIDALCNWLPG